MEILPTHHTVTVAGIRNMTYDERLAENTAALRTHGKLIETVAEIAWNMALARFRPNDSYEFQNLAKDWAAEFEALYEDRIASCEWDEDAWRERCEHFTREKVEEVVLVGLGRILAPAEA
jgi:lactate dehydrogenase-like 2-hydroxyacid dehydrogenase